jgi:hypothetical protein
VNQAQLALAPTHQPRVRLGDLCELVSRREAFSHRNLFARGDEDNYVVYSFATYHPIYVYLGSVWYANSAPACAATTKHLALCRPDARVTFLSMGAMRGLTAAVLRNLGG